MASQDVASENAECGISNAFTDWCAKELGATITCSGSQQMRHPTAITGNKAPCISLFRTPNSALKLPPSPAALPVLLLHVANSCRRKRDPVHYPYRFRQLSPG